MLREHKSLVIRWDDEKAVTTAMTRSTDFKAMFFGNAHSAISRLTKSKNLMVESDTYRRGIAVDAFTVHNGEEMVNYVLKRSPSQSSSAPSSAPTPDKLVQDLQIALNERGFNAGSADGYMGPQTQVAIIAAQKAFGLPVSGLASDTLLLYLRKSTGGIPEGVANNNQAGISRNDGYGARVRECIQPGVAFPTPPRSGSGNPAAVYRVQLRPDGAIADVRLTRGSGNPNFDRAVETGIRRCTPFPRPPSGSYPGYIDVSYNMYN
jgi:TonB family protein